MRFSRDNRSMNIQRRVLLPSLAALVLLSAGICRGQDPTKAAPDSYKLQFENEHVKVLRVRYAANAKVPVHDHSKGPAAYVYLTDSGPIRFTHAGWEHPVLTRPAVQAGALRLSPTRFDNETHEVENPNATASEFLRIELKTEAPDRQSLVGRFPPPKEWNPAGVSEQVFDNSQLRVTRLSAASGKDLTITADPKHPALLVRLTTEASEPAGSTVWLAPGEKRVFPAGQQILRFDLKTAPKKFRVPPSGGPCSRSAPRGDTMPAKAGTQNSRPPRAIQKWNSEPRAPSASFVRVRPETSSR
jgi:hypothetical protein